MQISQQTIDSYKEKFRLANPKIVFYEAPKTWYKNKFQFKICFNGTRYSRYRAGSGFSVDNWYMNTFGPARIRQEVYQTVFTNSDKLLDFILNNPDAIKEVVEFWTSSEQYVEEMQRIGNIAVDVKLVSPRSYNPKYKYEIEFDPYFSYQLSGGWASQRGDFVREIVQFCKTNKDDISAHPHMLDFAKNKHNPTYSYYNKMSVYAHNDDIILQLVMMYQERINKIYKLVEKVKK